MDDPKKKAVKPAETEKEFNIKIKVSPRRFLKKIAFLAILLLVFFAGRWTVPDTAATDETSSSWSITGFLSGLIDSSDNEDASPEANASETNTSTTPTNDTETSNDDGDLITGGAVADVATAEPEEAAEEEEEENNEPVITSYSKVAVALTGIQKEVKEADVWGKIIKISYTIKNNEEGTIKPGYMMMTVEGYNEEAEKRKVLLPENSKTVLAGQSASGTVTVPGSSSGAYGFNYHKTTAGNLQNVRIDIILFDANSKPMASYYKEFDLSGSS